MEETENFFKCASCLEKISPFLDVSVDGCAKLCGGLQSLLPPHPNFLPSSR